MTETLSTSDLAKWLHEQTWSDFAQSLADYFDRKGVLSEKQEAAARSMHAKVVAKQAKPETAKLDPITEPGMYRTPEGTIYRVQFGRGTKNLYAKVLVITAIEDTFDGTDDNDLFAGTPKFKAILEYTKGAVYILSPDMMMTLEEAKSVGKAYGICCVCGAQLEDPKSVERGLGPWCAKKGGFR